MMPEIQLPHPFPIPPFIIDDEQRRRKKPHVERPQLPLPTPPKPKDRQ